MRPLRYSINLTLDGCCHHEAIPTDEELHGYFTDSLAETDALLFGRVTYEMMEAGWRPVADGARPDWMAPWMEPFAHMINAVVRIIAPADRLSRRDASPPRECRTSDSVCLGPGV